MSCFRETNHLYCRYNLGTLEWGKLVRCSPHASPKLLQKLDEFIPPWDSFSSSDCESDFLCSREFYHIVQWLKVGARASYVVRWLFTICQAHPEPPLELIERWQGYLNESRQKYKHLGNHRWDEAKTDVYFEKIWQRNSPMGFNITPQGSDEEDSIRRLERTVETMGKDDSRRNSFSGGPVIRLTRVGAVWNGD